MFDNNDWTRILVGLGFNVSIKILILQAMAAIETDSPELVPLIQAKLTELEQINALIASEQSSPNSALIKADVLEWSENQRLAGMLSRRQELKQIIFDLLNLANFGLQLLLPGATQPSSGSDCVNLAMGW